MNDNRLASRRPPSVLVTERLILRTPCIEDAFALHELASFDESFTRATFGEEPKTLEATCTAIARMLADRRAGAGAWWVVAEKDSARIIGLSGYTDRHPEAGLVTALACDALGNGYALETVEALANVVSGHARLHRSDTATADHPQAVEPASTTRWYWHSRASRTKSNLPRRCA